MSIHQSIERQEREFKELLQTVMQAPLSPLTDSVRELNERMGLLAQQVSEMREIELSLNLGAEDTRKQIRSLTSLTKETSSQIDVLQPVLTQLHELHSQKLSQQLASGFRQLGDEAHDRMSQLIQSMAHLQILLSAQQQELERLQKQQAAYSERLGEQIQSALQPLSRWIMVSVCVAAASLAAVVAITEGVL